MAATSESGQLDSPSTIRATATSHWTDRGLDRSKSVLQTLLHRQLGSFHYSSDGGAGEYEVAITRKLFNSRAASDDASGKPVKATKIELKHEKRNGHTLDQKRSPWAQIGVAEKTEMSITDTRIWTRKKGNARGNANVMAKEEFYSVEPSSCSGLKCIKTLHSSASGKMKKAFVIAGRSLTTEKATTHFLTLMEPGILRSFDLLRNQVTDELKLPLNISQQLTSFHEMDVFDNSRKIFIIGKGKKMTKAIIVLNYPPWKEMGIVHVHIPVEITLSEGICFILQGKLLQITTWPLLYQNVKKCSGATSSSASARDQSLNGLPNITSEGMLTELPTILTKIHLHSEFYGLMSTNSVPMFYGALKTGLNFFTFHDKPHCVYEFQNNAYDAEDPIDVFPFSDGSSKALICTTFSRQSQLVEFHSEWNEEKNEKLLKASRLVGFDYWEKSRQMLAARPTASAAVDRRPRRTCVNNNAATLCSSKIAVLGMAYCVVMDLIAVLTADEEEFHVAIYEPLKLAAVKALPPVYVWPRVKGTDDVNKKRESITSVEFAFEPEFIFIAFIYSPECKPQREVFLTRLLSEIVSN